MHQTEEQWVIEWSHHQRAWHVETVQEMIDRNNELFYRYNQTVDFVPLGIVGSHREASDGIVQLEKLMVAKYGEDWRKLLP